MQPATPAVSANRPSSSGVTGFTRVAPAGSSSAF
jgi:hypothetical protein